MKTGKTKAFGAAVVAMMLSGCGESTPEVSKPEITVDAETVIRSDGADQVPQQSSDSSDDYEDSIEALIAARGGPTGEQSSAQITDLFSSLQAACDAYASIVGVAAVDPERFANATILSELYGGAWLIDDGAHDKLVVDFLLGTVMSIDGPGRALPGPYGVSCPEDVFLGAR